LRSESLKHKQEGRDVREALYQGIEIGGAIAGEAKTTADSAKDQSQNIDDRFNDQIAGSTNDNEVIDFRHSDMLSKSFTTAKLRGDFFDNELQSRGVNVKWFGAVADGTTDNHSAFQQAIDYAYANFLKLSDTSEDSITSFKIVIPAGAYAFTSGLVVPPIIKLVASGFVKMISKIADDTPLIWIKQKDTVSVFDSPVVYKQAYTRGYILDGTQGGIMLSRDGATESNPVGGVGLAVGNDTDLTADFPVARYSMCGVMITGFQEAIHWYSVHHYLGKYYDFHVENNVYGLVVGDGTVNDSNENFSFCNSIFALCKVAVYSKTGWDISFDDCSFDFNQLAFQDDSGWGKMVCRACHIEGDATNSNKLLIETSTSTFYNFSLEILNCRVQIPATQSWASGNANIKFENNTIIIPYKQSVDSIFDDSIVYDTKNTMCQDFEVCFNVKHTVSKDGLMLQNSVDNFGQFDFENSNPLSKASVNGCSALLVSSSGTTFSSSVNLGSIDPKDVSGHRMHFTIKYLSNMPSTQFDLSCYFSFQNRRKNSLGTVELFSKTPDSTENEISTQQSEMLNWFDSQMVDPTYLNTRPYLKVSVHSGIDATDFKLYILCVYVEFD
jgi:hypothetical protein